MTLRVYLAPQVELPVGPGHRMRWVPKVIWQFKPWSARDYGFQRWCLVVGDYDQATHNTIVADPEVVGLPQNLDLQIGANLQTVKDTLEMMQFPADWVQATHTYRQVGRLIYAAIRLFRHVAGILNTTVPFLVDQVTLDTQFKDLPQAGKNALLQTAEDWHLDTSGLTNTATIRQIIKFIADQLPPRTLRGLLI